MYFDLGFHFHFQVPSARVAYYYVPTFEGTVAPASPYWALTQDGVPVLINSLNSLNTV